MDQESKHGPAGRSVVAISVSTQSPSCIRHMVGFSSGARTSEWHNDGARPERDKVSRNSVRQATGAVTVVAGEAIDHGHLQAEGEFARLNEMFNGKLGEITVAVWAVTARRTRDQAQPESDAAYRPA